MEIIFLCIPDYGHISPVLPLLQHLFEQGHHITSVCYDDKAEEKLEKFGTFLRFLNSEGNLIDRERGIPLPMSMIKLGYHVVDFVVELIKRINANVLLYDYMYDFTVAPLVAVKAKIPYVNIYTTPVTAMEDEGGLRRRIQDKIPPFDVVGDDYWKLKSICGDLSGVKKFNIAFSYPLVDPVAATDPNYFLAGCAIVPRAEKIDFPWSLLDNKQVIYVSMGTVVQNSKELLRSLAVALADIPNTVVVMSLGKSSTVEDFDTVPPNYICKNFVPQLEVLQRTNVFVTHSGWNSLTEAVYYQVPTIMIPQMMHSDQLANAKKFHELGVGLAFIKEQVTQENIRKSVLEILNNPQYKERITELHNSLKSCGGPKAAAQAVINFAKKAK